MWDARCSELGFDGGRVLEPGSGAGIFIGLAPAGAAMIGVELDPTTAAIAQALYPARHDPRRVLRRHALPDGYVRRGRRQRAVRRRPAARPAAQPRRPLHPQPLHHQVAGADRAPAAWSRVLTSRYTLDASNPAARREMHALADLLGAVRLPSGAHRRAAGTAGRHRPAGLPPPRPRHRARPSTAGSRPRPLDVDGQQLRVNALLRRPPRAGARRARARRAACTARRAARRRADRARRRPAAPTRSTTITARGAPRPA